MRGAVTSTIAAPWIGAPVAAWTRPEIDTAPGVGWSRGCRLVAHLSLRKQGTEQGEEDSPQVAHSGQRQSRNSSVRRSSSPMTNGVASLLSRSKNASPGFATGRNPSRATAIA